jgi:hypothetical protein
VIYKNVDSIIQVAVSPHLRDYRSESIPDRPDPDEPQTTYFEEPLRGCLEYGKLGLPREGIKTS